MIWSQLSSSVYIALSFGLGSSHSSIIGRVRRRSLVLKPSTPHQPLIHQSYNKHKMPVPKFIQRCHSRVSRKRSLRVGRRRWSSDTICQGLIGCMVCRSCVVRTTIHSLPISAQSKKGSHGTSHHGNYDESAWHCDSWIPLKVLRCALRNLEEFLSWLYYRVSCAGIGSISSSLVALPRFTIHISFSFLCWAISNLRRLLQYECYS